MTAVDASARQLVVKPDNGGSATVRMAEQARILRVPDGEKDPQKFTKISVNDISEGDRVLARGPMDADGTTLAANTVYVMSKSDLAQRRAQERSEWQKRG
ncbi:MAG TPA: hypothetical protein VLT57_01005, partial [Bryobacteraceae bacterium]|nr:hypothetical protein [Bryobacteraceae bacterium]